MPILESRADQAAIRRNLLAASWGTVMGLFFGLPPALAAQSMGMPWLPYGVAVIIVGLVVGLLIAFTVVALFPRTRTSIDPPSPVWTPRNSALNAKSGKYAADKISRRLAEEKASLDKLDIQRDHQAASDFGKTTEERIIWNELLELELQDIDEQVSRIRSQASIKPNTLPLEGGSHERHKP
jgi:hypothetical protein